MYVKHCTLMYTCDMVLQSSKIICGRPVSSLRLAQAKLAKTPGKAALGLLNILFSEKELVNGNPSGSTTSNDQKRKNTIKPLDPERSKYIEGACIGVGHL